MGECQTEKGTELFREGGGGVLWVGELCLFQWQGKRFAEDSYMDETAAKKVLMSEALD